MLDGLLWVQVETRPLWSSEGYLQWVALERHRLTGAYRTTFVDDYWDKTHASQFAQRSEVTDS